MRVRFEATVYHSPPDNKTTKLLALDKCNTTRPWFEVINIEPRDQSRHEDSQVYMDVEWLAALRATHSLTPNRANKVYLPEMPLDIDCEWMTQ